MALIGEWILLSGLSFCGEAPSDFLDFPSAYGGFLGKDGSRAFVTGDFTEEGFTDDVSDFTEDQCQGLNNWVQFYADEAKYPCVTSMFC
jgi:hypothetical protein